MTRNIELLPDLANVSKPRVVAYIKDNFNITATEAILIYSLVEASILSGQVKDARALFNNVQARTERYFNYGQFDRETFYSHYGKSDLETFDN